MIEFEEDIKQRAIEHIKRKYPISHTLINFDDKDIMKYVYTDFWIDYITGEKLYS